MKRGTFSTALSLTLLHVFAAQLSAAISAVDGPHGAIGNYALHQGTIAFDFKVVRPIVITDLGVFDEACSLSLLLGAAAVTGPLQASDYVVSWGPNVLGQAPPRLVPYWTGTLSVSNSVLNGVRGIAAGSWHLLVLAGDGTVTGFGLNHEGQATGVPLNSEYPAIGQVSIRGELLTNVVAIAAGLNHSLALTSAGMVVGWGNNQRGQSSIPPGLTNVTAIAAGGYSSIALKSDGTVVTWGLAPGGRQQPDDLTNVVGVAATAVGQMHPRFLVLKKDGKVAAWGGGITEPQHDLVTPPPGLSNVVSIALGSGHSLALLRDGTIIGWGWNSSGEATGTPNLVDPYISKGVVTLNGEVLTNVIAIAAGHEHSLAVTRDGKVHAWGSNRGRECVVPVGLRGAKAVAAGQGWSAAITSVPFEKGE